LREAPLDLYVVEKVFEVSERFFSEANRPMKCWIDDGSSGCRVAGQRRT
jgi:hypothetical protein